MQKTKKVLIDAGVMKLKRLGFDRVSGDNILTDEVYKSYFSHMLTGLLGKNKHMDVTINQLLISMQ